MGTNYYLVTPGCEACGRGEDRMHIGKSSAGWVFSLHVVPERGINDLSDWQREWASPGARIEDEYGREIGIEDMVVTITQRRGRARFDRPYPKRLAKIDARLFGHADRDWHTFHRDNHSERGPRGLLRHQVGRHCLAHGKGTWDLIAGEFC